MSKERIVVQGESAREMINEIENPTISPERLELFRKAIEVAKRIRDNNQLKKDKKKDDL